MSAVGRAKSIVDVEVGERSQGLRELFVIGLLFGVKPHILQEQCLARLKFFPHLMSFWTDALWAKAHVLIGVHVFIEQHTQALAYALKAQLRIRLSLGAA